MPTERAACLILLALLQWLPPALTAQTAVPTGTRVRVVTHSGAAETGLLLALSSDSLLIGVSYRSISPQVRARADVASFQTSLGGDGWRAAIVGAQLGLGAGALAFGVEHLMSRSSAPRFSYDNGDLAIAAATGAVWGLLIGAATGAVVARERWEEATPQPSNEALPPFPERATLQTKARLGLFADGRAIRLRTQDGERIQGRYDGYTNDFVRIVGDSSYLVPIASIREISEQRPLTAPWLKRGMLLGAALGAAFVGGVALNEENCDPDSCLSPLAFMPAFTLGGAFTGGALGAILGSHVKGWRTQKW